MKRFVAISLTSLFLLAFTSSAMSEEQVHKTMQSCAELLPDGYEFAIDIKMLIDTYTKERKVSGEIVISDDTQISNPVQKKKVEPFEACIIKLIK